MFAAAVSSASPANCHEPRWIAAAHQPANFDCVEVGSRDVAIADGAVYRVRALHGRDGGARDTDDLAKLLLDTIAQALKVYDRLDLPIGHVSIVFYPAREPGEMGVGRETGAPVPLPAARATVFGPNECIVLVPLAGSTPEQTKAYAPELRTMAAHLVVHCIQAWRWPIASEQAGQPNAWWVEGSADALASAAEPLDRVTAAFITAFDRASPTTALTAFAYEASPFFMWLWRSSPTRFGALLDCVARTPGHQTQCLATEVGPDDLNRFARDYLQRRIVTLLGEPVPIAPKGGDVANSDAGAAALTGDVPIATLWRGRLKLGPGVWTIAGERPLVVSGVLGSAGWQPLSAPLAIPCSSQEVLVYAMPTAAAEQRFAISAVRTADATCPGR